jgi:hypothetical protein
MARLGPAVASSGPDAMAPELPDPAFAKIVVLTPDAEARLQRQLTARGRILVSYMTEQAGHPPSAEIHVSG